MREALRTEDDRCCSIEPLIDDKFAGARTAMEVEEASNCSLGSSIWLADERIAQDRSLFAHELCQNKQFYPVLNVLRSKPECKQGRSTAADFFLCSLPWILSGAPQVVDHKTVSSDFGQATDIRAKPEVFCLF